MSANETQPVQVYFNIHRADYSVRQCGKVVDHKDVLILSDCTFVVNQKARQRAIETRQRNVHAYIRGYLVQECPPPTGLMVIYDLYRFPSFVTIMGEEAYKIDRASFCVLQVHERKPVVIV